MTETKNEIWACWLLPRRNLRWLKDKWHLINFDFKKESSKWDEYKQSMLIHSIIYGFQVPPIYFVENKNKNLEYWYSVIDGRQRMDTVNDYLNDKFALHVNTPMYLNEEIAGKMFSELNSDIQNKMYAWCFDIVFLRNITEDEIKEQILRLEL